MIQTIEAVIDQQGNVRLLEPVRLAEARRALVMILEEQPIAASRRRHFSVSRHSARTGTDRRRTRRGRTCSRCGGATPGKEHAVETAGTALRRPGAPRYRRVP